MTNLKTSSISTSIQTEMSLPDYLNFQAETRHKTYRHVIYTSFPDIRDIPVRVFWGVFSWVIPSEKTRYVKRKSIVPCTVLASTPGDVVRDYLDYYHPRKLRAIAAEAANYRQHKSAPLFFKPSITRKAMYIDIDSCYFSIVSITGWNVNYYPGKWLTPGRAPLDFPLSKAKGARSYLTSIGLPGRLAIWTGSQMLSLNAPNAHINLGLWSVTQDILHSIANTAISLGSTYVHTDGCIIPEDKAEQYMNYVKSWGLQPRIVADGTAYVIGFGNYQIGNKRTLNFDPARPQEAFCAVLPDNPVWLKQVIGKLNTSGIARRLYDKSCLR